MSARTHTQVEETSFLQSPSQSAKLTARRLEIVKGAAFHSQAFGTIYIYIIYSYVIFIHIL
jgi:hypothetical protein